MPSKASASRPAGLPRSTLPGAKRTVISGAAMWMTPLPSVSAMTAPSGIEMMQEVEIATLSRSTTMTGRSSSWPGATARESDAATVNKVWNIGRSVRAFRPGGVAGGESGSRVCLKNRSGFFAGSVRVGIFERVGAAHAPVGQWRFVRVARGQFIAPAAGR